MTTLYVLFALLVFLQVVDAWSTITLLRRGGRELNAVMAYAMGCVGRDRAVLLMKLAVVCIGWALLKQPEGVYYLAALVIGYAMVCAWNIKEMRKAGLL